MNSYKIEGMKELEETIKTLEKLPQKCVNTAARKGALISKNSAKQGGWVDQTGYLRKGIVTKAEKTKIKGKKVYDVLPSSSFNDVFVKPTKEELKKRKKPPGKRYYYPASQEYGFKTRNGGYVPGFHFLKKSITENATKIEKTIVDVLSQEIDKLK